MPKRLASGSIAYYFSVATKYKRLNCPISDEPLGADFGVASERATTLNGLFNEWYASLQGAMVIASDAPRVGTVEWLFRQYKQSNAYLEKVAVRSRKNYEWAMREVCDAVTNTGATVGSYSIKAISPRGADKIYELLCEGPKGARLRTAEKIILLCPKAWRVVHRLYPKEFPKDVPNPWIGVTLKSRTKRTKAAVTREQVYTFAQGCIERGQVECAATAVICFEWLQRPENVVAGHVRWTGYRTGPKPTIEIEHHKTGAVVNHPLEEDNMKFYADAEEVLVRLPRRGIPMILREVSPGKAKPYSFSGMQKIVQRMRKDIGLPSTFTLDACRHGGMTELEEAELTEGQGRALSAHRTRASYAGYAKRTEARMLAATRKRYAHRLANQAATSVRNEASDDIRNEKTSQPKSA